MSSEAMSDLSVPTSHDKKERESLGEKSEKTIPSEKYREDVELSPATTSGDLENLEESRFLKGKALFLVFVGMLLSIFLVALDQTIVSPALPGMLLASNFSIVEFT
jgi:hypothetical protein